MIRRPILAAVAAGALVIPLVLADLTRAAGRPFPTARSTLGGCTVMPPDNMWNTRVDTMPLRANSAAIVATVLASGGANLHPDFSSRAYGYGMPYWVVPATQPKVPIRYVLYGSESDPGPFPIPLNIQPEAGDRHVIVVQQTTCMLYELYGAYRCGTGWCASSGARFNLRSNAHRRINWTSADAAGLPILPGLARCDEIVAGHVDHAIRFTVSRTRRAFVLPATHAASSITSANYPAMGMRFRLKKSYNITGFTGQARILLEAFKKYGLVVADNGSNWFFQGQRNGWCWNDDNLNTLKRVPGNAFEVVDSGPVLKWPYNP